MIRDDTLGPVLDPVTATQFSKIYWNAQFTGAYFTQEQVRVWGYLTQRVIGTTGWNIIKGYQAAMNVQQAWLEPTNVLCWSSGKL